MREGGIEDLKGSVRKQESERARDGAGAERGMKQGRGAARQQEEEVEGGRERKLGKQASIGGRGKNKTRRGAATRANMLDNPRRHSDRP